MLFARIICEGCSNENNESCCAAARFLQQSPQCQIYTVSSFSNLKGRVFLVPSVTAAPWPMIVSNITLCTVLHHFRLYTATCVMYRTPSFRAANYAWQTTDKTTFSIYRAASRSTSGRSFFQLVFATQEPRDIGRQVELSYFRRTRRIRHSCPRRTRRYHPETMP